MKEPIKVPATITISRDVISAVFDENIQFHAGEKVVVSFPQGLILERIGQVRGEITITFVPDDNGQPPDKSDNGDAQ